MGYFDNKSLHQIIEVWKSLINADNASSNSPIQKKNIAYSKFMDIGVKIINFIYEQRQYTLINPSNAAKLQKNLDEIIYNIQVLNATSVVGTIEFIDQISKYNLNFVNPSLMNRYYEKRIIGSESKYGFNQLYCSVTSIDDKQYNGEIRLKDTNKQILKPFGGQRSEDTLKQFINNNHISINVFEDEIEQFRNLKQSNKALAELESSSHIGGSKKHHGGRTRVKYGNKNVNKTKKKKNTRKYKKKVLKGKRRLRRTKNKR
jgi:hypothetical protein